MVLVSLFHYSRHKHEAVRGESYQLLPACMSDALMQRCHPDGGIYMEVSFKCNIQLKCFWRYKFLIYSNVAFIKLYGGMSRSKHPAVLSVHSIT